MNINHTDAHFSDSFSRIFDNAERLNLCIAEPFAEVHKLAALVIYLEIRYDESVYCLASLVYRLLREVRTMRPDVAWNPEQR